MSLLCPGTSDGSHLLCAKAKSLTIDHTDLYDQSHTFLDLLSPCSPTFSHPCLRLVLDQPKLGLPQGFDFTVPSAENVLLPESTRLR